MEQLGHHRPASTELLRCSKAAAEDALDLTCGGLESITSKIFDFSIESLTASSVLVVRGEKTLLFPLTTAILSCWNTVCFSPSSAGCGEVRKGAVAGEEALGSPCGSISSVPTTSCFLVL